MSFDIKPHLKRCSPPIDWALNYETLFEDLKTRGFTIESYKNVGDSPTFVFQKYHIWCCRQGYAVAELIDNRYCNHIYFNGGNKQDEGHWYTSFSEYDLERAINHVLDISAVAKL